MRSIIEIHHQGTWVPAAEFTPMGDGYVATFEYLIDYVFSADPVPVSLTIPVNASRLGIDENGRPPLCPSFLLDLVPQGRGRKLLIQELGLAGDGDSLDLRLAQHGAFNPVGNLRLDTAVRFYESRCERHIEGASGGFALKDILQKPEAFLDHIWLHAMLSAGTTGLQGAAPKFLLTENREGLWFADAALPDSEAERHWLVKLPRGREEADIAVLRNETAYLRVAARCGLRVAGEPMLKGNMLFVPRFDRTIENGAVQRLHQESLASLCGMHGFGLPISLFDLVAGFQPLVGNPAEEILEFMKRDILNMAMRNTDNHARNSAVQRLPNGTVRLTPVFDFAPMFLDPEMVRRGCRWQDKSGRELTDWNEIVDVLSADDEIKSAVSNGLQSFAGTIAVLPEIMRDSGVDETVIESCKQAIEIQVERLNAMRHHNGPTPKAH